MKTLSRLRLFVATALLLSAGLFAGAAFAQDASSSAAPADASASAPADTSAAPSPDSPISGDQLAAAQAAWKAADCSSCHGWSGNGHDTGPVPPGPSLRELELDYATIHTIIQCGVPSTRMPFHDRLAYTDTRCYDMTTADMGDTKPPKGQSMKPEAIDAVAAYVAGYLEGKDPTTKAECVAYYGSETAACSSYQ